VANNIPIDYQHFTQQLLDAARLPALIVDRTLTIHLYNQRAAKLLATTTSLKGAKLDQLLPDPAIVQFVQESIRTGSPHTIEHDIGTNGLPWKVCVTPLEHKMPNNKGGKKSGRTSGHYYFLITIEDLTEARRLDRIRRDFIANISHELRTPLATVRLLAETLEDAIETDPEKAQSFVEKIEIEVQYLTSLVSELLELSRIESGQVAMAIEPVQAEQLVRETMARMLPQAQRHRVSLHTDIQQGETLVAADSKQIARAFVNLVHNAIKFTPSGGTIVIGTALQTGSHMQCFFVRDTGIGIRAEELPRIFERFYKADRARSRADFIGPGGGGTGLGLAIARHVVEANGGRITAESTVGQGSTFTFTLPLATSEKS
jgi:two-component system phosphate regulon sensor histidine kinase PhoR